MLDLGQAIGLAIGPPSSSRILIELCRNGAHWSLLGRAPSAERSVGARLLLGDTSEGSIRASSALAHRICLT